MTKNLRRKMLRDLKTNLVQFMAIFVMCFLAMFILEAFDSDLAGIGNSVDEYYHVTNFADLQMISEGFTAEDLITIRNAPGVKNAELRSTIRGKVRLHGSEKKLEYNFIDESDISFSSMKLNSSFFSEP